MISCLAGEAEPYLLFPVSHVILFLNMDGMRHVAVCALSWLRVLAGTFAARALGQRDGIQ